MSSSTVPAATMRITVTGFVCPMRWQRSCEKATLNVRGRKEGGERVRSEPKGVCCLPLNPQKTASWLNRSEVQFQGNKEKRKKTTNSNLCRN